MGILSRITILASAYRLHASLPGDDLAGPRFVVDSELERKRSGSSRRVSFRELDGIGMQAGSVEAIAVIAATVENDERNPIAYH